jgi:uncharacterized protein YjeT (DUF2065 family)
MGVGESPPSLPELLLGAFALMLVIEGLLPFISPPQWRSVFERAMKMSDGQIRFIGLGSMLAGLAMLWFFLS